MIINNDIIYIRFKLIKQFILSLINIWFIKINLN